MKIGVVFFHSNIARICRTEWVDLCISSMVDQTYQPLHFYEVDYGESHLQLVKGSNFYSKDYDNHADAQNFIISKAFEDGCDYVFNTNMDDFYEFIRVEEQLKFLKKGYDIVSSDFVYVDEENTLTEYVNIRNKGNLRMNFKFENNLIAHPSVAYSKNFWNDPKNRYKGEDIPQEDLLLWGDALARGYTFHITEEVLLYYRRHANQICKPSKDIPAWIANPQHPNNKQKDKGMVLKKGDDE